ncbi:MAG: hypothetical protein ACI9JN_001256 [Bacteroidia bacterium]|jgi:hypothetical protein
MFFNLKTQTMKNRIIRFLKNRYYEIIISILFLMLIGLLIIKGYINHERSYNDTVQTEALPIETPQTKPDTIPLTMYYYPKSESTGSLPFEYGTGEKGIEITPN